MYEIERYVFKGEREGKLGEREDFYIQFIPNALLFILQCSSVARCSYSLLFLIINGSNPYWMGCYFDLKVGENVLINECNR